MKGYTVHLLFHILAATVGLAAGLAAALWWFENDSLALTLAVAAAAVGILVLVLHYVYIVGTTPARPRRRPMPRRPATRPSQPRAGTRVVGRAPREGSAVSHDTLVQPAQPDLRRRADEDTRSWTSEAFEEYESSHRQR